MSLDDDLWDDLTDEELDSLVDDFYISETEQRSWIPENEARWKRDQAAIQAAEEQAERDRIESRGIAARQRRAMRRDAPSEPYTRQEVYDRDAGRCYMCLTPLAPGWHIEHVVPLARGGVDKLENVRASCPSCNLHKGLQTPTYRY